MARQDPASIAGAAPHGCQHLIRPCFSHLHAIVQEDRLSRVRYDCRDGSKELQQLGRGAAVRDLVRRVGNPIPDAATQSLSRCAPGPGLLAMNYAE